jgi:hypothetical protein
MKKKKTKGKKYPLRTIPVEGFLGDTGIKLKITATRKDWLSLRQYFIKIMAESNSHKFLQDFWLSFMTIVEDQIKLEEYEAEFH